MTMHNHSGRAHAGSGRPETAGQTIRWAWGYDPLVRLLTLGQERRLREATLRLAALQPGDTVLDVGCGTGTLTLLAGSRVGPSGKVFGIDAAPEMIRVARGKAAPAGAVDFQVGVIEALQFPPQTFDAVLSSLMFHHLPGGVQRQGLAEIYRVLKPGGRLIIVDMQHQAGFWGHVQMALLFHAGLTDGARDLAGEVRAAGYVETETGSLKLGPIGYVKARRGP